MLRRTLGLYQILLLQQFQTLGHKQGLFTGRVPKLLPGSVCPVPACTFSSTLKLCEILVVGVGSCMYIFCFLLKGACAEVVMQHPSYRVHYVA